MIFKILVIIIVLFLLYITLFKRNRHNSVRNNEDQKIDDIMVECPTCQIFVSKKEAILNNAYFYCSKNCLLKK